MRSKEMLVLIRSIGNVPIQFDLLEIMSMYMYQMHTCDNVMDLIGNVPEFKWLARRWKNVTENVDLVSSFAGLIRIR